MIFWSLLLLQLLHVSTLICQVSLMTHLTGCCIAPDVCACLSVQIKIDNEQDRNGTLYEAYDFLLPRQIKVQSPFCK